MVVLSKCAECKHFIYNKEKREVGIPRCKAFPDGIPMEVFKSLESVPCTDTISFEPEEDEE